MLNKYKNIQANINKVMYEGQMYTDPQEIVEAFNDLFCTVGDKLSAKLPNLGNEYRKYITSRISDSFFITPVQDDDIVKETKCMKQDKAPGIGNIGSKLLKLDPAAFCYPSRHIFNKSIEDCNYPEGMKIAKVAAIFKKGTSYFADNYRSISLLSSFNKIFEKILH